MPDHTQSVLNSYAEQPDAYIIHDPNYPGGSIGARYNPGDTITLSVQKFRFNRQFYRFEPVMVQPVIATFHVHHYFDRCDDNYGLPYQLDGVFTSYDQVPIIQRNDPVFNAVGAHFRFTFRFDPRQAMGCLVHFGTDIAAYERAPMSLLWLSAINLNRQATTNRIMELASRTPNQYFPVIPSER